MLITIILLVAGLALIIKGGDAFVDASSWMAEKTGIPKLIIGATVVSLATTLPEMIVSFIAAAEGKVDMAIGNAVGSVTVNIGLIMGIALICMPAVIRRREYLLKTILMLGAAAILVVFGFTGQIGLVPGILLIVIFALAMWDNVRTAKMSLATEGNRGDAALGTPSPTLMQAAKATAGSPAANKAGAVASKAAALPRHEMLVNILKFVLGAAGIIIGSNLLVENGSALALLLGVPERIIAVSVVAIGTSLPELVTTLTAIVKKQCDLSVGNVIGANIIDLTLILPVSSLLAGQALPVSAQFARVDLPACLLVGCMALIPALIGKRFYRAQGIAMVIFYLAYLVFTVFFVS